VSLYGLAFLSLGIGVGIHGLLIVLGLPFLIQVLRQVFKASGPVSALLIGVRSNSQKLQILFGILLIAGLALSF
jgi:1,4-dihydroxy-2-naphthoate octaprenyltransferase